MPETLHTCGLDFGTSNSCIAAAIENTPQPVEIQKGKSVIPTAVFYGFESPRPSFGLEAMDNYLTGEEGRLMRSLKSTLGTTLFDEKTSIRTSRIKISDVLSEYIKYMKTAADEAYKTDHTSVVIGRPVNFHNHNIERNEKAQNQLKAAAESTGFEHIEFQFEPIAAALDYESTIDREELAIVIDIGGGTSDFSIVKVSPEGKTRLDRSEDVLANEGIRLGGTDIDKLTSLNWVMPKIGRGSTMGEKNLPFPSWYFSDLATWHKINSLYDKKLIAEVIKLSAESHQPDLIKCFIEILQEKRGHELLAKVEDLKIDLSSNEKAALILDLIRSSINLTLSQQEFETTIDEFTSKIVDCIKLCLEQAGLKKEQLQSAFLTGGGTRIPKVQRAITKTLPQCTIVNRDSFSSVAKGLALDAQRKFA